MKSWDIGTRTIISVNIHIKTPTLTVKWALPDVIMPWEGKYPMTLMEHWWREHFESIENVWHFVALISAYGNRFSHEIYAVIYIFILVKKKNKNENPSMTGSLKSFFLSEVTHQLKGPRLPSRPSASRVELWRISLQFKQPWRWSANPESQTETTTCYVRHSLEVSGCAWAEMYHLTGLSSPVLVITSKQIQKSTEKRQRSPVSEHILSKSWRRYEGSGNYWRCRTRLERSEVDMLINQCRGY